MSLQLRGTSGYLAGQTITLPQGGGVIGRGSGCTVVLADDLASRQHVVIQPAGSGWTIADLGSTNGTRLNGRPLPPQQATPLQAGDQVEIGASAFLVVLTPVAVAPPVPIPPAAVRPRPPVSPGAGSAAPPRPAPVRASRPVGPWTWLGRLLAAVGGVLLIAGAFLPWLQITITPTLFGFSLGEKTATVAGMQGFGPLTLAIGGLLVLVVVLDLLFGSGSRWPGVVFLLLVVAGVVIMGIGVASFETASDQMARQLGKTFGVDLLGVLESPVFREILNAIGDVVQPELALREGVLATVAGLLAALLGSISRLSNQ